MRQQKLTGLDWLATKIPLHYKSIKYIKVDVPIVAVFSPKKKKKKKDKTPRAEPDIEEGGAKEDVVQTM